MSIQNVLTAALFKRDEAGRTVMFPNGAMGRGYIVPDTATERRMRRTIMWLIIGAGLLGGLGMQVMFLVYGQAHLWGTEPWAIAIAALVPIAILYRVVVRGITRDMTPVEQRMGMVEGLKRQAEAMPRWYLIFMIIVSVAMLAGAVSWIVAATSMMKIAIGLVTIVLFAAILFQAIHGLAHRSRMRA
jgi:hypothetical protein